MKDIKKDEELSMTTGLPLIKILNILAGVIKIVLDILSEKDQGMNKKDKFMKKILFISVRNPYSGRYSVDVIRSLKFLNF